MAASLTNQTLAAALRDIVRAADLGAIADSQRDGLPLAHFPSIDLAVVAFPAASEPVFANVLFSRDFPEGVIAEIGNDAGSVRNVRFVADQTDAQFNSIAWQPDSNWAAMSWKPLAGDSGHQFVAPYPASLIKFMVLLGVARLVDAGLCRWADDWHWSGKGKSINDWCESMIVASNNDATSAMVALLHHQGFIVRQEYGEHNQLNQLFADVGLHSLRLSDTRVDGGWGNMAGAGVGHLQMTAWDTVRLMWLLRDDVPAAPWRTQRSSTLLSQSSRDQLWGYMAKQGLHEILSATSIAGISGWQSGIAARLPDCWIQADGSVLVEDIAYPADVRPANCAADATFAHKTGNTENYTSDAGWVEGDGGRRYLIAILTNLGSRYAPHPSLATDWRLPQIGGAIDNFLRQHLESTV